ncbi:MAG: PilZ domain-containing protein [Desulfuromusa sp.]|nr:PilZ domain-containing protein [Desulfuromusa sp.]
MLMMKCPQCNKYINSELLAEIESIVCEHCEATVPVINLLVSSNGFTFDRNHLLKQFFRYRQLLDEVIDERNSLSNTSDESKRSLEQFMTLLQGMMAGARGNFRYEFSPSLAAQLCYSKNECSGILFNLSTEGACVEIPRLNPLPRVGGSISIEFSLPDQAEVFLINGEICWTRKAKEMDEAKHSAGVKFDQLGASVHTTLWQYISGQASAVEK